MIEASLNVDLGVGSHVAILASAIAQTDGPILECGAGSWSTPLIHYAALGRFKWTLETDGPWLDKYRHYQGKHHQFEIIERAHGSQDAHHGLIKGWAERAERFAKNLFGSAPRWSVVFLDQSPGEARVPCALALKDSALFIVCHDTEADIPPGGGNYGWKQLDGLFKYQRTMKRIRPWTTVYSNFSDFYLDPRDEE